MKEQDYKITARSRLTDRHRSDETFLAILDTLVEIKSQRQKQYLSIADTLLDIDKSEGKNLDLIGKLIGEERTLVNFIDRSYFGFLGARLSESYDIGYWYSLYKNKYGTLRTLTDEEYRRVLKARVVKNSSDNNRNSFLEVLNILLGNDSAVIVEYEDNVGIEVRMEDVDGLASYYLSKYKSNTNLIPIPLGRRLGLTHVNQDPVDPDPVDPDNPPVDTKDLIYAKTNDNTYDFYVRYLNTVSSTVKVDSTISKPTLADWQQVATAPQIVSIDDLGNVSVNVDYTKAHPYFAYELDESQSDYIYYGVRTGSGFADIPYFVMVSDRIKQLATQDPDREDAIMRIEVTMDGEVDTSDLLVSDFLYALEGDFTEDGFNAMPEVQQTAIEHIAGISSNGAMSISLLNMDNGEVLETLSFSRNVALTTPDIMNQFKLPIHEALEFTLSEVPLKNVGIFQWNLVGDEWDRSGHRVGYGRQVIGGSNPYIGQTAIATLEDNVIKIQGIEGQSEADVFAVRSITSTAVWLFIPDQHVTITNVSHAVQYDLKHFSNGTVIYFYLAALGDTGTP